MCWMGRRCQADGAEPGPLCGWSRPAAGPGRRCEMLGRVAAEVEVTSSRSFLFIFLFPEFHCYYSNNRWSPACHHCVFTQPVRLSPIFILQICTNEKGGGKKLLMLLPSPAVCFPDKRVCFAASPYSSLFI